ncbi:peptidoglycan-recognition protein SB1 [Diabrotica virgifera virgifera]|uniref:Peptidoglycan-recognition protein n=1 Tax=Diabrotica virgifera virgifera TaxID=50390 RepID=A0A6P7F5I6_DIAVI|nr:peptidoglycan-recognition protein SB1 [Diabrotica virgifera virgifera]
MVIKVGVLVFVVLIGVDQIAASCPTIISRSQWGASAAKSKTNLSRNPPPYVVIHHSETPPCPVTEKCKQRVKNIQYDHINNRGWSDIGYNFLIGGDGNVYEGRGWGLQGSHCPNYNSRSIGICLIGDFQNHLPSAGQLEALKNLIDCGVQNNKISSSYKLIGHRQGRQTKCPGDALYEEVTKMPHWEAHPN